jgi:tetratricopeptide (TPR) repeat protein
MRRARRFREELEYSKSEKAFLDALRIVETPNRQDPHIATTHFELGSLYQAVRQDLQAEHCYRRALDAVERSLGPDHPLNALVLSNLLSLYVESGQFAKAQRLQPRCRQFAETLEPDLPHANRLLESLGLLAYVQRRYTEAERYFRMALKQMERAPPQQAAVSVHLLGNLALAVVQTSGGTEAEMIVEQARDLAKGSFGTDWPVHVEMELTGVLAAVYMADHRDSDAEAAFMRVLELASKSLGPAHPTTAGYRRQYSVLLRRMGKTAAAKEMARQADAILREHAIRGAAWNTVDINDLGGVNGRNVRP